MVLIVHRDVDEIVAATGEFRNRVEKPCAETIGIGGNVECDTLCRRARFRKNRKLPEQFGFQHADMVHVPAEPLALSVATQGLPRTISTTPRRSSSCLIRWETAEGVTHSTCAAFSKLPVWATSATARMEG